VSGVEVRVGRAWLRLREGPDAAARSTELVRLLGSVPASGVQVVHDLGCGDGAMGRWLAPRLPGPQHWVLHDRDADLLTAGRSHPPVTADGTPATVETREDDVTRLAPHDLAGASLITASALLDMLTGDELDRLVRSCVAAGVPVLLTLSVTGRVRLAPADPMDAVLGAAFDAHQRRATARGPLLGPDAVRVAVGRLEDHGCRVRVRPSPWRLGPAHGSLLWAWLQGWVGAAVELRPELGPGAASYLARRAEQLGPGRLRAVVGHLDVLAVPGGGGR
jgi:trans-aconitate methyltransferase